MSRKKLFELLERIAKEKPELCKEIEDFAKRVIACGGELEETNLLAEFKSAHPEIAGILADFESETAECGDGKIFPVHKTFSDEIRQRIKLAKENDHYANWANAIKSIPAFTLPLPVVDSTFLSRAKEIWKENVYGNDEILRVLLRHCIEYSKHGKTMPILLLGDPGIGKTLVARTYGKIMNLPCSFLSGPSAASGRGLAGAPNLYSGAGVGAVVQAMIDHKAGNPVLCIDELDKAVESFRKDSVFQNELLSLLDESGETWYDNFLEISVDASHLICVMTANEINEISRPLLDRMEIIRMEAPDKETMHNITKKMTLPEVLRVYEEDRVCFPERELDLLVDMLWDGGNHSCRPYQKAVSLLVSDAYLAAVETNSNVCISEENVRKTAAMWSRKKSCSGIGFVA